MYKKYPTRGAASTRRALALLTVAAVGSFLVAACDDSDGGVAEGGAAGSDAAGHAGVGGATVSGAAGTPSEDVAGAGGVAPGEGGAGGADAGAAGAAGARSQNTSCADGGALFVAGNYADAAGSELILRAGAKAATFALIPPGARAPSNAPRLFLVERVCAPGGALIASDGGSEYRVDFSQSGSTMIMCFSAPTATFEGALTLPAADVMGAADTGCAGKPFTAYTLEAL